MRGSVKRWLWPSSIYAKIAGFIVLLILLSTATFLWMAKRPQFHAELQNVVDEGEWLRLEFAIKNQTRFDLEVATYGTNWPKPDRMQLMLVLQYNDDLATAIHDQRTFPEMYSNFAGSRTLTLIKAGETRSGLAYLHQDLADGELAFHGLPNDGGIIIRKLTKFGNFLEDNLRMRGVSFRLISMFKPTLKIGEPFVPNRLINETTKAPVEKRLREFLTTAESDDFSEVEKYRVYTGLVRFAEKGGEDCYKYMDNDFWNSEAQYEIAELKNGLFSDFAEQLAEFAREVNEKRIFQLWKVHRQEDLINYRNGQPSEHGLYKKPRK